MLNDAPVGRAVNSSKRLRITTVSTDQLHKRIHSPGRRDRTRQSVAKVQNACEGAHGVFCYPFDPSHLERFG
ncbi:hypothetical protein FVE85_6217 [Porphyridium purpureum]|uniref:Uncharacterized protein n=1 Tax=Porphyridium purpureum TaxID=35688 RepID=A0A5J4Z6B0_PORPP|nr:hypothetical protein FVE85_6217 [Porphyridium purpureum]|eukprot:POR2954..scf295_1